MHMKKNYKFTISYDGSKYYGWEKQKSTDMTIQGKLENLFTKMTNETNPVTVIGAGRTDAGVHAKAMVCNAFLDCNISTDEIKNHCNHYLPEDICILDVKEAGPRFHSRYNALGKTYCYSCYAGNEKPVFDRKYVYKLDCYPDVSKMREAAKYCIGKHDFKCFCGNPKMKKSTVRTINSIVIEESNGYIKFYYHGDGFLQHMVRILTGTLLEIGMNKREIPNIIELIEKGKRSDAGFTAPALGLCLESVDYH